MTVLKIIQKKCKKYVVKKVKNLRQCHVSENINSSKYCTLLKLQTISLKFLLIFRMLQ